MIKKANIDVEVGEAPRAVVEINGYTADVYPYLSKAMQRRINRSYEIEMEITMSQKALRLAFPELWAEILQAKRIARKLPAWILNRAENPADYTVYCMECGAPADWYEPLACVHLCNECKEEGCYNCEAKGCDGCYKVLFEHSRVEDPFLSIQARYICAMNKSEGVA